MSFDFKQAMQVKVNVGEHERKLRYGAGAASLLLSIFLGNILLLIVGCVLVYTAQQRFCPVYGGLGKSSLKPGEAIPETAHTDAAH